MISPIVFLMENVDSVAELCNLSIKEKNNKIYFSPLQSKYAIDVLNQHNVKPNLNTFYFYNNNKMHDKSSAALKIIPFLKWQYYFLLVFGLFQNLLEFFLWLNCK